MPLSVGLLSLIGSFVGAIAVMLLAADLSRGAGRFTRYPDAPVVSMVVVLMTGASFVYSAMGGLGLGWFVATSAMLVLRRRWVDPPRTPGGQGVDHGAPVSPAENTKKPDKPPIRGQEQKPDEDVEEKQGAPATAGA